MASKWGCKIFIVWGMINYSTIGGTVGSRCIRLKMVTTATSQHPTMKTWHRGQHDASGTDVCGQTNIFSAKWQFWWRLGNEGRNVCQNRIKSNPSPKFHHEIGIKIQDKMHDIGLLLKQLSWIFFRSCCMLLTNLKILKKAQKWITSLRGWFIVFCVYTMCVHNFLNQVIF